jgi:hypothetical protein
MWRINPVGQTLQRPMDWDQLDAVQIKQKCDAVDDMYVSVGR